ncbi:MAG: elongation factor P [Anaerolineales bacterium]|nr:elongation factor P [Anaerolineales bacterium]
MIDVNDLRKGITFEKDNDIYKVLEYTHHKPRRGKATIRVKARNLRKGTTLDMSFISGDRVQDIRLDHHNVQYLYKDGNSYIFMDLETYEQPSIPSDLIEDVVPYLREGMEVKLTFFGNEPLDIDLPTTIDLKVVRAEASAKGDTATGVTKKVETETGLIVDVPGFVKVDDTIRVDTRNGSYVTRV